MIAQISQVFVFFHVSVPTLLFYTDPGSGALIIQLLFAAVFGGLFYLRKFKDKIFGKKQTKEQLAGDSETIKADSKK